MQIWWRSTSITNAVRPRNIFFNRCIIEIIKNHFGSNFKNLVKYASNWDHWDLVILHDLNDLEEILACVIAFDLCLATSVMLRYRNISPLKLQAAMMQRNGAAKKSSTFLGNKWRSKAMQQNGLTTENILDRIFVHSLGCRFFPSFLWVFFDDRSSQSFYSIKISASLSNSALKIFSKVSFDVASFGFLLLNVYFSVLEIFNSGFLICFFIWSALKALPTPDFNVLRSLSLISIFSI